MTDNDALLISWGFFLYFLYSSSCVNNLETKHPMASIFR